MFAIVEYASILLILVWAMAVILPIIIDNIAKIFIISDQNISRLEKTNPNSFINIIKTAIFGTLLSNKVVVMSDPC